MVKYTKEELVKCDKFKHVKDLIFALVKSEEKLSIKQVEDRLKTYKERKI